MPPPPKPPNFNMHAVASVFPSYDYDRKVSQMLLGRADEDHTDVNESWDQASTIPILRGQGWF